MPYKSANGWRWGNIERPSKGELSRVVFGIWQKNGSKGKFEDFWETGKSVVKPETINELKEFYAQIEYGTVLNGKKFTTRQLSDDVLRKAHILSSEELEQYKIGTCYDTAGYSVRFLKRMRVPFKCIFLNTRKNYDPGKGMWNDPTHTTVIYKDASGGWKWIEGSWWKYKNNDLENVRPEDLIMAIKALWSNQGYCREIAEYPKEGTTIQEAYYEMMCDGRISQSEKSKE